MQLVEAKIVKKEKHSFTLELHPSGDAAFLSKDHLSDSKDNQELLWQALKPGQIIKDLMLLKQANVVVSLIVKCRHSFCKWEVGLFVTIKHGVLPFSCVYMSTVYDIINLLLKIILVSFFNPVNRSPHLRSHLYLQQERAWYQNPSLMLRSV